MPRIRERKDADQEGREIVFVLNKVRGAESQGLGPMRACVRLARPQAMGSDSQSCTWGEVGTCDLETM